MPFDRSSPQSPSQRPHRLHPLAWAIAVALAPAAAGALPQDGVVKQGAATIQTPQNGLMVINQSTQTTAVDWRSFSVGKGETVNIVQPSAQALLINRVIGYDPTRILGQINANGRVVLSNPRGVYFSADSQVDVGSLVATTLGISDADLQSGRLRFGASTDGAGELRAEGRIRAADAVALIAPQLTASGSIEARRAALAAASQVSVDVEGDGLVLFNVRNDGNLETRLDALGTVNAAQSAELRAVARAGFADTVLNMEGIVRARSLEGVGGKVVVDGGKEGISRINGTIDASSGSAQTGGDVLVQGQKIMLDAGAQLDASGDTGGGRIRVGGDFHGANAELTHAEKLIVRSGATLSADAGTQGDGGQVVLWSEQNTVFLGALSARGGATGGNGGRAEVSGRHGLSFDGSADLSAVKGKVGQLLLDPDTITIVNSNADAISASVDFADPPTDRTIGDKSLQTLLGTQDVHLHATNTITVNNGANVNAPTHQLELAAGGNITINNATLTTGGLTLSANNAGGAQTGTGAVSIASGATLDAGSGTILITSNGGTGTHAITSGATITAGTFSINGNLALGSVIAASTINILAGTTELGANDRLGNSATVVINGGTLSINSRTDTVSGLSLQSGSVTGTTGVLTSTSDYDVRAGSVSAILAGGVGLTKSTTGTVTLGGANTYSGKTSIQNGALSVSSLNKVTSGAASSNLGAPSSAANGTIDLGSSTTTGTLIYTGAGESTDRVLNLAGTTGGGTIDQSGDGLLKFTSALTATGAGSKTLTLQGSTTGTGEIAGVIVDSGSSDITSLIKAGSGTWTLSGANTYSGKTSIQNGALSVSSLNSVSAGTTSSNLGAPTSAANGTIDLGSGTTTGTLVYTGTGETTDRVLNLAGTTGGGTIDQSGTGLLKFTSALTATGVGSKTLTLQGSTAGTGEIAGAIVDNGATDLTALTKAGTGSWTLSGPNTYAGGTTVNVGTLGIAGGAALLDAGAVTLADTAGAKLDITDNEAIGALNGGGATGGEAAIAGTKTLTVASGSFAGVISGTGSLTKNTTGTLTLSGANTYSGQTSVQNGTLSVSSLNSVSAGTASSNLGAPTSAANGSIDLGSGATTGTLVYTGTGETTDRVINLAGTTGGGTIDQSGTGLLKFTSALTATGAGSKTLTLQGSTAGTGEIVGAIVDSGSSDITSLTKAGSGSWTLSGTNTYAGTTTISAGTLQVGAGGTTGTLGSGNVTDNGTLVFNRSDALTVANAMAGTGSLQQAGTGTTTISGTNTYAGTTTVSAGTLALGAATALPSGNGGVIVNGRLDLAGISQTIDGLSGSSSGVIDNTSASPVTLTVGANDGTGTFAGTIQNTSGALSLAKVGTGVITLSGANTYTGTTTLSAGTLQVGAGGTTGTLGSGNVTNNAALVFNRSDALTVANAMAGTGSLEQAGTGTTTLTGANSYGTTTISAGTLQVGAGGTTGTLGSGAVTNNAALVFNRSDALTVANAMAGTGSLEQAGAGTTTLSGANAYTGGTTLTAGTLALGSAGALGTVGTISFTGGTLQFTSSNTTDYSARFSTAASQAYKFDTNGQAVTLASALTSSGGSLTKSGTGTLTLTGANTYAGTTISNGALQVGAGGTTGTLGSGAVTNNGVLILNRSDALTVANAMAGTGSLQQAGAGTTTLTGTNTYAGATTVSAGTLQVGAGGTTGTLGSGNVTNNAALVFNRSDALTVANAMAGTGSLEQAGAGTTTLSGTNTYAGTTTISAGTLQVGAGGTTGTLGSGAVTNNAALVINRSDALTVANAMAGTGSLEQAGTGTTTLGGVNAYTGGTTLTAGTLALGSAGALGTVGTISFTGGTLQFTGGNTTDYSARFSTAAAQAYKFDTNGQAVTLASALTSSGGSLTKSGTGTLTLTGANTYAGTTISDGALQVGAGGTTGTLGSGNVTNNGALVFNRSDALTVSKAMAGTGSLEQAGTGTTTLTGANAYTGGTTLAAGTLALGSAGALGTVGTVSFTGGTLQFTSSNATDYSARFSTAASQAYKLDTNGQAVTLASALTSAGGSLTKSGSGTLTLTGANTYSGLTTIATGGINVGGGGGTGTLGTGAVTNNGTLTLDRNNALTVSAAIGGAGSLVKQAGGITTLTGTNTYTGATLINAGTLQVGAGGTTGTLGTGNVIDNAVLAFNRGDAVTVANTIGGSGALAQLGSGTLTLTANNTYGGATTIAAGSTLNIGGGGSSGTLGTGAVTNDGSLVLDRANALTVVNSIGGSGSLTQQGAGTTTLSGSNGHSGGTSVTAGQLTLGANGALGSGALSVTGGVLDIGAFSNAVSSLTVQSATVNGSSGVLSAASQTLNHNAIVNANLGAGALTSHGTVALNGTSAATTVDVASGMLTLGAADRLADTAAVGIASGATLKLAGHDTVGSLATAGTLDKTGATDTLTASSGGYTLNAGAVVNANLGAGTLTGLGNATLNGSSAAATVNVAAGTLTLGAAERLADNATATVASGATLKLGGSETVGSLALTGTLDKAAPTDTLQASTGHYTLHGGAVVHANLGTGTLTSDGDAALNGAAAATTVQVSAGRLTLGGANLLADGATVTVHTGAFLKLGGNDSITQLNLSGQLESDVDHTLTATAATGYVLSGGVTQLHANLGAGMLSAQGSSQINGTTAATALTVTGGSTLTLGSAPARLLATPDITVEAGGTLTLLANNTAQSVSLGAGAQVNGSGTLTAIDYVLDDATYNGDLGGGKLTSRNNSRLNGNSGATTLLVETGSLTLGSTGQLTGLPNVIINGGATLALARDERFGSLAGAGTLALGSQSVLAGSTQSTVFSGAVTGDSGSRLTKEGLATTFTLSGASANLGLTVVKEGTLLLSGLNRLGSGSSLQVDSGALLKLAGSQTLAAASIAGTIDKTGANDTLTATTYALNDGGVINANLGSGAVTSHGSVTLNGTAAASSVTVATGQLALTAADRLGDAAAVSIASGATLKLNGSDTVGSLTAAGTLAKTGATDTLTAGSYTLNSGATIDAALGTGALTSHGNVTLNVTTAAATVDVTGGTLTLGAANRLADTAAVSIANGATLKLNGSDAVGSLTAAGTLAGTGAADMLTAATYTLNSGAVIDAMLGTGTLTSNGHATLNATAAAATVNASGGTLTLGAANRLLDTAAVSIAGGATLALNGSDTVGSLVSAGTLAKTGATDTLSAATYALNQGAVIDAHLGAGALTSHGNVAVNGTVAASVVHIASGTLTLGAADRLADAAGVTLSNGATLKLGGHDTVASLTSAGTLAASSGSDTLTATAGYTLNDGAIVHANLGAGTLASSGSVALNGTAAATAVNIASGTLTLGAAHRLADTAAVSVAGGAALKLNGNDTVGTLTSAGTLDRSGAGDTLTAGSYALNDGAIVQAHLGSGTLTSHGSVALHGTAASGGVNVASGTLALGAADRLADTAAVSVSAGATLRLNGSDTVGSLTSSGTLAGTAATDTLTAASYALGHGAVVHANLGAGTLTSQGSVALNGTSAATAVNIATGTLTLGAADRLVDGATVALASGATLKLGGNDRVGGFTSAGTLERTGADDTLTATTYALNDGALVNANLGAGTLTSHGSVVLNGRAAADLQVATGTLALGGADRLADSAAVGIASGATLRLSGNDTVGALTAAGTLARAGAADTLTAASYALHDGAVIDANLGAGALTSHGNVTLHGTAAASTVSVASGTLGLGAADRLSDGAAVGVASGATLRLNGNDTVGTLALAGTLDKTGAADTLTAATTTASQGARLLASLGSGALRTSGAVLIAGNAGVQTLDIDGGTLQLAGSHQFGAAPATTLASGATLALNGSQTLGSLSGAGAITASAGTLAVGGSGDSQYDGIYSGAGALRKQGSGTLVLSNDNSYTGGTQIAAGTLQVGVNGTRGALGSGAIDAAGTLRLQRSDAVTLGQVSGSGGIEQAGTGTLTLDTPLLTTGTTRVSRGALVTAGAERIANAGSIVVDAGASLTLGGHETLAGLTSAGNVELKGDLHASGDVKITGRLSLTGPGPHSLTASTLEASNAANLLGSQPLSLSAQSAQLKTADNEALKLGSVRLAGDSTISAGTIELTSDVTLTGGTTTLLALAAPAAYTAEPGKQAANAQLLSIADATLSQTGGLIRASGGALALRASGGGSITLLDGAANDLSGGISAVSGTAGAPWDAHATSGLAAAQQSRISLSGDSLRVNGPGVDGDLVVIDAARLSTASGSTVRARLPYSSALGFAVQLPGLTLKLREAAFTQSYSFGGVGDGNALAIDVGSSATITPAGFITLLPKKPANLGATAIYATGPVVGANGYQLFYDGARRATEVPVVYNGIAPSTPEAQGSISATVAVSEGARKDRFDEAVRTENVAIRLRSGVIAEVGAGRPATIGKEGIRPPENCSPSATLRCEP